MACDRNTSAVGRGAAVAAGIAATASRAGYTAGSLLAARAREAVASGQPMLHRSWAAARKIDEVTARSAAVAAYLAGITGPARNRGGVTRINQGFLKAALYPALKITLLRNPAAAVALRFAGSARKVGDTAASVAAAVSKTGPAGQVFQEKRVLFLFKSRRPVALWRSGLTGALNRRDLMSSPENVVASDGVMFKPGKGYPTWHRGTTVVNMSDGQRTVTHLQSLSLPGAHYYFDRAVSDEHAVGLAAGKIRPEAVPGYAGQVTPAEMLCPGWAASKHALLKAHLHYGPRRRG